MRRTVVIPPFFAPGGIPAAEVTLRFTLVDAEGDPLPVGFEDEQGIVGQSETVTVGDTTEISLSTTDTIRPPGSFWEVTASVEGKTLERWVVSLESGATDNAISLVDLLGV